MLRLLILSVLILNTSAKLFLPKPLDDDDDNGIYSEKVNPKLRVKFVNRGSPLWVVTLSGDNWLAPKLRLGNTTELEDFFKYIGPMIRNSVLRSPPVRVKKDDPDRASPNRPQKSNAEIRNDFIQIINKFALSTTMEPDAYISDNNYHDSNNPIVSLFFKGPYTSLMVELGRNQWNYFIDMSSSLPQWFFESHDPRKSPILVPEDVKTQLFSALRRLLHVMFGFPV